MKLKNVMCAMTIAAAMHVPVLQAADPSRGVSYASAALSNASGAIVYGSVQMLAGAGSLVVASMQVVGESTVLVLKGASGAVEVSLKIATEIALGAALAVGSVVVVVAGTVGYALMAASRMIAFVPNDVGRSLLYQAKLD